MMFITKKKKSKKKWHRVNFFMKEKKTNPNMKKEDPEEHPTLIFSQSKTHYKGVRFTSHPTTHGKNNEPLLHNIDPDEKIKQSYGVPYDSPRPKKEYQPPDKFYRVHKEDKDKVNRLKKGYTSYKK